MGGGVGRRRKKQLSSTGRKMSRSEPLKKSSEKKKPKFGGRKENIISQTRKVQRGLGKKRSYTKTGKQRTVGRVVNRP